MLIYQWVSILARPEGRALQLWNDIDGGGSVFQSSPAPKDGRYACMSPPCGGFLRGFNPRPPRRTGATIRDSLSHFRAVVSILARPEGRALRSRADVFAMLQGFQSSPAPKDGRYAPHQKTGLLHTLFQSSPAPKDGRYDMTIQKGGFKAVSILARPEGRALRMSPPCGGSLSGFNPRPPRRTGATSVANTSARLRLFQSSPAPKDGRYTLRLGLARCCHRFNPRPPRRTGAT